MITFFSIVLVLALLAAVGVFIYAWWVVKSEDKRFAKMNDYPKATPVKKYPLILDSKLDYDVTESFYH